MKQTARIISTYSADVMGVCSALYELGGMTVMHDASGCNSTYTTHDEPRWYDMDSMVYISGLSEIEAIMGDDEKLIGDIEEAAMELHPAFIAIAGTPIPAMTGFDFESIADVVEQRTGIPAMGFATTGMNTYIRGASMAFRALAERFVSAKSEDTLRSNGGRPRVNIIGLTPLDFSTNGTDRSIAELLEENGFEVVSSWAMGSDLDDIRMAGSADVNLVVSACGIDAAQTLLRRYGTPYVIGVPYGTHLSAKLLGMLRDAASSGCQLTCSPAGPECELAGSDHCEVPARCDAGTAIRKPERRIIIIGEGVSSLSLALETEAATGYTTIVLCATECPEGVLRPCDRMTPDEDDIIPELEDADVIIADPLYRPICPEAAEFIPLPSVAFSGRMYAGSIPDLVTDFSTLLQQIPPV